MLQNFLGKDVFRLGLSVSTPSDLCNFLVGGGGRSFRDSKLKCVKQMVCKANGMQTKVTQHFNGILDIFKEIIQP